MSGGSYDYLCWKESGEAEIEVVDAMVRRLEELGCYIAAHRVSEYFKPKPDEIADLRDLLHAVEWRDSNDWGDKQLYEAAWPFMTDEARNKVPEHLRPALTAD